MAHLLLMRHAKSDWSADSGSDFDRPLNERGIRSARLIGRLLTDAGLRPELVISSPAVRAISTARLAAEAGGWDCPIREERVFYEGALAQISDIVRSPSNPSRVLAVGHQPTWSFLAESLTGEPVDMRTATVAVIERRAEEPGSGGAWGILERVIQPRDHLGSEWDH